jgi:2-C-methyl-D-erythritol 2,4-cyclodiphosphate synthase
MSKTQSPTTVAILLAAGTGKRLKKTTKKAFIKFQNQPLFLISLKTLTQHKKIQQIILVVPRSEIISTKKIIQANSQFKNIIIVAGGDTRFASLKKGLNKLYSLPFIFQKPSLINHISNKLARTIFGKLNEMGITHDLDVGSTFDLILSHNAANPFLTAQEITKTISAAAKFGASGVGRPANATLKKVLCGRIQTTLDRAAIWLTETPQVLQTEILLAGIKLAQAKKIEPTDELQLAELIGIQPKILLAADQNRKITTPFDLAAIQNEKTCYRIGFGQDSHAFAKEKKPLILGGFKLSNTNGLDGNSDGDVALHALINAIASALGKGSISNFADSLCMRGVRDSKIFLAKVFKKMCAHGFELENIALGFEAHKPKLEKKFPLLRRELAKLLNLAPKKIGLTATSGEGLTSFGQGKGMQVFCVVLLKK